MQIVEYSYSNFAINQLIWYISSITNFAHFIDPQNFVLGLRSSFVYFIHPYINLVHSIDPQNFALGLQSNLVHFMYPYLNPLPPAQVISPKICDFFKSTLFYKASLVAASEGFMFPACNFIKKETPK